MQKHESLIQAQVNIEKAKIKKQITKLKDSYKQMHSLAMSRQIKNELVKQNQEFINDIVQERWKELEQEMNSFAVEIEQKQVEQKEIKKFFDEVEPKMKNFYDRYQEIYQQYKCYLILRKYRNI
ncbi:hypothetical protein pb186bvf_007627 [Paramecium bursaria]